MRLDYDLELIYHLADPESVAYLLVDNLSPEIIEDDFTREILIWQYDYVSEHEEPATKTVLEDEFDDLKFEEPQTEISDLVKRIRTRYIRNNGKDILEYVSNIAISDPIQLSNELIKKGKELSELTAPKGQLYKPEDTDILIKQYDVKVTKPRGPSYGFEEIDDHFYCMDGVTYLIGAPKSYKSWNGIINGSVNSKQGRIPYIYSLEMPSDDYTWRLKCYEADVPYWKYLKRCLSPEDKEKIKESSGVNWIVDKPRPQERGVSQLVEKALNHNADYIIIDQLQYVESNNGHSIGALNDTKYYWEVCEQFRSYSERIPILVLHQYNRSVQGMEEMPDFQQIKGSAAIEETATMALGVYSSKDMRNSNIYRIGSMGSRHWTNAQWEIHVELTRGCRFNMIDRVEDES